MHISSIAVGALLFGLVSALPAPEELGKRSNCHAGTCEDVTKRTTQPGTCNADNLLRNLRDKRYSVSASAFCSTYIQATLTETENVAAMTTEVTVVIPDAVTTTTTNFMTLANTFVKRNAQGYPTWLPATYPPSRVSSACSCFVTPSAPVTVTRTITTGTITELTTTTAPAPTTTLVVEAEGHCAVPGCHQGPTLNTISRPVFTFRECIDICDSTPTCQAVQFGSDGSGDFRTFYCNLFNRPISDAYAYGFSTDSYCSTYKFYDVNC